MTCAPAIFALVVIRFPRAMAVGGLPQSHEFVSSILAEATKMSS